VKKKFRTLAITIPFLLFMFGEQQVHPFPVIHGGEDELHPEGTALVSTPVNKTDSTQKTSTAKVAGGSKILRVPRKHRRKAVKTATGKLRRKAGRNSSASLAARRLYAIRREYVRRTRRPLIVTSFRRSPAQQARAIRNNIRRHGMASVLSLYGHSPAIREIANAYRANRRRLQRALRQMTVVIQKQIARDVFISHHLRGLAVDIRSRGRNGAQLSVLRDVARKAGGKVSVEADHFHVRLV